MTDRRFGLPVYAALKAATAAFVERNFGYHKVAAAATRVQRGAISDYCNRGAPDFMPIDVLADLTDASRDASLLKALADTLDYLLVPLPGGSAGGIVAERTGRSAKEFGELMMRIGAALGDNRIERAEARAILAEIRELMLELAGLAEAVKSTAVEEGA